MTNVTIVICFLNWIGSHRYIESIIYDFLRNKYKDTKKDEIKSKCEMTPLWPIVSYIKTFINYIVWLEGKYVMRSKNPLNFKTAPKSNLTDEESFRIDSILL